MLKGVGFPNFVEPFASVWRGRLESFSAKGSASAENERALGDSVLEIAKI